MGPGVAGAYASQPASPDPTGPLSTSLVVPGSPAEGEELQVEREAKLDSPEAVSLREESQTKFEGLDSEQAAKVAGEAFPALVNEPAGGPPKLPTGESIVGFSADNAAQIDLPGGNHGVIESTGPMAVETSAGHRVPVDLSLNDAGNAFEPKTPAVEVKIPKQLGEGVQLSSSGVSLTPVTEQGSALGGSEGTLNGATVFYANTQTNTDTLAKPTTGGFEIDSLLRSVESPEALFFKVRVPAGASLVSDAAPGGARVMLDGKLIAVIAPVSAQDAAGTGVPVQMSVAGDMLIVSVPHGSREYQYPIEVDPQAYDETLKLPPTSESETETNLQSDTETDWRYHGNPSSKFISPYSTGYGYVMDTQGSISNEEHDEFRYGAHGQASVGFIEEESSTGVSGQSGAITKIEFASHSNSKENELTLAAAGQQYLKVKSAFGDLWNESEGHYQGYNTENLVRVMQTATKEAAEGYGFWFELNNNTWVGINQKTGPSVSFNTSEATIAATSGRQNVLYGSGGWLGEHNGAVEIMANDPGLGVSDVKIKDLTAGTHGEHWEYNDPVYAEHLCTGVWCSETFETKGDPKGTYFTYNKEMAEGANTFEVCAEDEALMKACADATVKVDDTSPSNIKIKGIAESGAELNATPHQLTAEATDATSGIKSIAVSLDGKEIGSPAGSCSPGECTASHTVTIDGEGLGAGEHKLKVTTFDNADNEAPPKEYTFGIRNATPVHLGPGTVDPVTGQFALTASDADIAGSGSVSRTYMSRSLSAGLEGPLGPQWKLNVDGGESLKILPDRGAELVGAGGEPTIFSYQEGKFKAPPGDENLTLEAKEKEGKVVEYLLQTPTTGAKTVFTLPPENGLVIPRYFGSTSPEYYVGHIAANSKGDIWAAGQGRIEEINSNRELVMAFGFGVSDGKNELETCTTSCKAGLSGSQNGEISGIEAIAVDGKGHIWVTEADDRIQEFAETGAFVAAFAEETVPNYGQGSDEVHHAKGIAIGANGTIWVADTGNNRVDEFNEKREFVAAFGFGVLDSASKFEICTTSCRRGVSGSGSGQFSEPEGIAVHNGDMWVTDTRNNRVEKFNEKYEYLEAFGSLGSGNGQFSQPRHIAVDSKGHLWVADGENGRVEAFTEGGSYVGQFGSTGSEEERLSWIDFWSGAGGVAVDSNGNVWVVAFGIKEWAPAQWLPTRAETPAPGSARATAYQSIMVEGNPVTEPTEILGPVSAGVTCGENPTKVKLEELKAGCRALTFTYAEATTATGEGLSEWGEYRGRLKKVSFTAYNPASKAMQTTAVAEYSYDKQGRLRAEWDPRISPALKTTYGYDSEGHVTTAAPSRQQPWMLHYGAIASDPSTGRLLSITRSGAASGLWNGKSLENTAKPTLSSTSPVIGTTLSVSSNGTWNNGPLAYGYQWEDCTGSQCTSIAGATNYTYTPQAGDAGYTLVAQVTATNAGGSAVASSAATSAVPISAPKYSLAFGSSGTEAGKVKEPTSTAIDSSGDVWVTDPGNARIDEFSSSGGFIKTLGFGVSNGKAEFETCTSSCQAGIAGSGNGQFSGPWGIAVNRAAGDVYVSDQANRRVEEFTTAGAFVRAFGVGYLDITAGVGVDPNGDVWVADCGGDDVVEFEANGDFMQAVGSAGSGDRQFSCPGGFAFVGGNMYVADFGNKRIQKFSLSGAYLGQFASVGEPYEINENAVTGEIYESDFAGKVDEFNQAGTLLGSFGTKGTGNGQFEHPTGLAVNSSGDVYVVDASNNRLQEWTPTYSTNNPLPEPPSAGSSSVSTVEYRVPLWGSSAPYQMTSAELAKWGQTKDLPEEATAIFPPDEPMGWPAKDYKRATVLYMDEQARTTNTTSPSGAISTVEYNTLNEMTRTLTAADRAIALKETGKTAEAAKALSSEKIYNTAGTQLLETYGPEHKIKLANGSEEETRNRQKFSYNEGEPSKEEAYNLVTKSASWAEGAVHKELDKHETVTSYNGQENLGWKLRKPTMLTATVEGHTTTTTTKYEKETGETLESTSSVSLNAPVYASSFGSQGTGGGQFEGPWQAAIDSHGNVWVTDRYNMRIEEFSSSGAFMLAVGWGVKDGKAEAETCTSSCQKGISGLGNGEFEGSLGIAINQSSGNIYVADGVSDRVQEFSSSGAFVAAFGSNGSGAGQLNAPEGISVDSGGNVWVADTSNNRLDEFSSSGTFLLTSGWGVKDGKAEAETCTSSCRAGTGGLGNGQLYSPTATAFSDGEIYVTDFTNARVEVFTAGGAYVSKWGTKGTGNGQFNGPYGIATDPVSGDLYVADSSNNRIQQFTPSGSFVAAFGMEGSGNGQLNLPSGVAVNPSGEIYVVDHRNQRVQTWQPTPASPIYASAFGSAGTGAGKLEGPEKVAADSHGDLWVADYHNKRIEEFSPAGAFMLGVGWGVKDGKAEAETCTASCQVGISGTGNGQFEGPFGIAVNQSTGNVYVSDFVADRVEEFSSTGAFVATIGAKGTGGGQFVSPEAVSVDPSGNLWVADSANHRIQELSSSGTFLLAVGWGVKDGKAEAETCTASCQVGISGIGNGQLATPTGIAFSNGNLYVSDYTNDRVLEFSNAGAYLSTFGSEGSANGKFVGPYDLAADPTDGNLYVDDRFNYRIQEFTPAGGFLAKFGSNGSGNGQFLAPQGVTVNSTGTIYVGDNGGDRIDEWRPAPRPGNEGAHNPKATFYTAKGEAEVAACQNHPEWTGLVCQTEPTVQPGDSGPPPLPVTTTTYNIWDEPEVVTEKLGLITRTSTKKYDGAGREVESQETSTSSEDKALPAVTDEYSSETGALVKLTSTIEGKARTVTSVYNTLGQLTTYTDVEGSSTKYTYDIDGRTEELSEPKGKQTYTYDPTTGFLTKLLDSAAGTFTASYGVTGEMLTEGYPNGMTAKYTYNSIGQATNLEYEKTTHCSEKCVWFSDAEAFGPSGELAHQASTLSTESYSYSEFGQLTQTQETPVGGKGCITRLYGYNEASGERESSTTREPNEKGECTTEGGVVEGHFYDVVGRLLDPGVTYDAVGNMTKVPALDAGGMPITSSFYVDNQAAVQEQNEKSIAYTYDPAGRTMIAKIKTKSGTSTAISHYSGPGEGLTWRCEEEGEGKKECEEEKETKWTRNILGIDGALDGIQTNGETAVLQLHDLQGNIIATAADNETETKLLTTQNSTEFGVPPTGKTSKYAWLGADDAESELETGVITETGATYVPQLARTLQTEQAIPPGAAPDGVMDVEAYRPPELSWANQSGNEAAANTVAEQRALEIEAEGAACMADPASCVDDPYALVEYNLTSLKEQLTKIEWYVLAYKAAEAGEAFAPNAVGNLITSSVIDVFIKYSHTKVSDWATFFGKWEEVFKSDIYRLEHRGPKDAEFIEAGIWFYEYKTKNGQLYIEPYAFEQRWCWYQPGRWCSSNSKTVVVQ